MSPLLSAALSAALWLAAALVLGVAMFVWHWRSPRAMWMLMAIPSRSKIPIFGDVINLMGKTPAEMLEEFRMMVMTKTVDRYLRGVMLGIPGCMLFHPDDIEILLGRNDNIKKGYEYFPLKSWLREGLLLSDGKKWRERRKLLTPTFHFRILEDNVAQVSHHSKIFVDKLKSSGGSPVQVGDMIKKYTLDVICETAMGVQMNAQRNESIDYVGAIKSAAEAVVKRTLQIWLSRDWLFNLTSTGRMFTQYLKVLHGFTEKVIAERKEEKRKNKDDFEPKRKKKAFLDMLLEAEEQNPGTFTSLDIREEVDTFMFEGHDTTSAAISFAMYSLANHQDVQEQVYEEQERIFGRGDREPSKEDLQEMNYLEMVIKEVLRLYPSVPFMSRTLSKDMTLASGVTLGAGTCVSVMPYLVHRNPDFWEDPEEFRPERFSPGISRHPYSYIPFSAGPRNCIGMKFAMLEIKTTLSTLVRRCKIQPVTTKISLNPIVILTTTEPIEVKILPRNHD